MRSMEDLMIAVARGIARLDNYNPTWAKGINWEILDIESIVTCVIAQVFPTDYFFNGLRILGIPENEGPLYGFDGRAGQYYETYSPECEVLTGIWREVIKYRQEF